MTKRKGSIRVLIVLSDLHCGSTVGLLDPDFVSAEDNRIPQNAVQRWLWRCWRDLNDNWIRGLVGTDPYALILNGDLREGTHHGTKQVISPDTADHDEAAVRILTPLAERAAKVFVTKGTECHTGNSENAIAKRLGAVPPPDAPPQVASWDTLGLNVAGIRCAFRHHVSTTTRHHLRAGRLSIALANEQLEAVNNGEDPPRVVGFGHCHLYDKYEHATGLCFTTHPWQLLTRFANKIVGGARTKPGGVVLDWRNRADGELPQLHARSYRTPTTPDVVL